MTQTTTATPSRGTGLPFLGGPAYLNRTVVVAAISGAVAGVAGAAKWGPEAGLGFVLGLAWGLANFLVLAGLLRVTTTPGLSDRPRAAGLLLLKLVLYGAGIGLLFLGWVPALSLVAGFSWLFTVVVLRAAGAWLQSGRSGENPAGRGSGVA